MDERMLGRTGERLSMVGFGGIVVAGMEQKDADATVVEALDAGINYFDVAPTYGDAEERLGPALEGKRDGIFLACKTTERTKDGSLAELERSLSRLKTDRFDVYQLHGVSKLEDVQTIFGPKGAMETFLRARDEGKTRFIGFSAHSEEAALALMDGFDFDTILFPINWVCWYKENFGPRVVERAKERNMGLLALKAMARQQWPEGADRKKYGKCWYQPEDGREAASLSLRFAWSHGITACIPPGDPGMWRLAVSVAEKTDDLAPDEGRFLKERVQKLVAIFPQR